MAEHLTRNEKVVGSIPTISSIYTGQKRCHEQKHREIGAFVVFFRKYQPFHREKLDIQKSEYFFKPSRQNRYHPVIWNCFLIRTPHRLISPLKAQAE